MSTPLSLPLAGIRVLDLSRVLAGPWCGMVLGDFGADVIKVEHPERGDDSRDWGLRIGATETAYFACANRNKRSVTLNLRSAEGQLILRDLVRQSDVVIQNFKPGDVAKMGLGFDRLQAIKPDLLLCSITGYDPTGPEASRPGYDLVAQGETGLMALNGEASQPPLKFGIAAVDLFTGMYAAQAVLAALFERQRTGKGRHLQLALFDCGLMLSAYVGLESLLMQREPPRYGNAHPSIVPYGVFDTADDPIVITVGNNAQFARFCRHVIDRVDLADDPRFSTNLARAEHRDALVPQVLTELRKRPRQLLLQRLTAAAIPCGEVLGLYEALTSERARGGGLVTEQPHPTAGGMYVLAPPYRIDRERLPIRFPPPLLGEGTQEVLSRLLGLTEEQMSALKSRGVL